jgi:hypothetical protein
MIATTRTSLIEACDDMATLLDGLLSLLDDLRRSGRADPADVESLICLHSDVSKVLGAIEFAQDVALASAAADAAIRTASGGSPQ